VPFHLLARSPSVVFSLLSRVVYLCRWPVISSGSLVYHKWSNELWLVTWCS
jgi:hypothetical protein